ncbi:hypothetical protein B4U79_17923 [Dinothrombium tinctorium]|uniref:DM domain-containing protein n=1 Tax=Dinothrombium tinctorium TaxID=1965070 RepID=A0A3S3PLH2_9ACAR|nr:hypothetical protein B4U79_17923 [Dinothrombium tinctorium]
MAHTRDQQSVATVCRIMKAQSKNRKHPTCSRCRFHGIKDIRVLQHQCPYKNCTCSSCLLIKRSIIYRAQKNLDKNDDNSDEQPSSPSSISTGSSGCIASIGSAHLPLPLPNHGEMVAHSGPTSWVPSTTNSSISKQHSDYSKISDFQTLCVTFPDYSPSHLQTLFGEFR